MARKLTVAPTFIETEYAAKVRETEIAEDNEIFGETGAGFSSIRDLDLGPDRAVAGGGAPPGPAARDR